MRPAARPAKNQIAAPAIMASPATMLGCIAMPPDHSLGSSPLAVIFFFAKSVARDERGFALGGVAVGTGAAAGAGAGTGAGFGGLGPAPGRNAVARSGGFVASCCA